jgi:signal transduction histidine kinase
MELQENSEKAGRLIQRCLEEIDQEARTLRHIRHAMAPIQLEYGFTPALERLVESFKVRTGVSCILGIPEELEYYLLPQGRLPLYRVIQQALDNIDRHAEAEYVEISLILDEERIHFHIADNGRGSSEEARFRAQSEGSFGLKSMAARIQNLGGVFQFESAIGEGTRINGWIPR